MKTLECSSRGDVCDKIMHTYQSIKEKVQQKYPNWFVRGQVAYKYTTRTRYLYYIYPDKNNSKQCYRLLISEGDNIEEKLQTFFNKISEDTLRDCSLCSPVQ